MPASFSNSGSLSLWPMHLIGFEFSHASGGCYSLQVDVVKSFNDSDGPQWKHSFFGNPNDPETFRFVSLD